MPINRKGGSYLPPSLLGREPETPPSSHTTTISQGYGRQPFYVVASFVPSGGGEGAVGKKDVLESILRYWGERCLKGNENVIGQKMGKVGK
jgi:hypothetical protein